MPPPTHLPHARAKTDRKAANDHADDTGDIGENVLDGIRSRSDRLACRMRFCPGAGWLSLTHEIG